MSCAFDLAPTIWDCDENIIKQPINLFACHCDMMLPHIVYLILDYKALQYSSIGEKAAYHKGIILHKSL